MTFLIKNYFQLKMEQYKELMSQLINCERKLQHLMERSEMLTQFVNETFDTDNDIEIKTIKKNSKRIVIKDDDEFFYKIPQNKVNVKNNTTKYTEQVFTSNNTVKYKSEDECKSEDDEIIK